MIYNKVDMMKIKEKRSMLYMLAAVAVGFICAVVLCFSRYQVELRSMSVEQAMDYEALAAVARNDGYTVRDAEQMARESGITSFAVYETTLNKLAQRGDISLVTALTARLYYPQLHVDGDTYTYYLVGKPRSEEDPYFDEVKEDLVARLGTDNVADFSDSTGYSDCAVPCPI